MNVMAIASPELDTMVRAAIEAHLADGTLSLPSVAAALGVHPRSLQRRLNQLGLAYRRLVDEVRFDRARCLLESTETPIFKIARRVGYDDPAHFSRAFNRWAGISPQAYRDAVDYRSRR